MAEFELYRIIENKSDFHSNSVAFSSGNTSIAASRDGNVYVWDINEKLSTDGKANLVAFSNDGFTFKIWNTKTMDVEHNFTFDSQVMSIAISPDGSRIMTAGYNNLEINVWNINTGVLELTLVGHIYNVRSVAFSHDGSQIVSGSIDRTVKIWNASTGEIIHTLNGHTGIVTSVAFNRNGTLVASGSTDHNINIWNTTSGKLERTLIGHDGAVTSLAFNPDGSWIVSGSNADPMVLLWNTITGKLIQELTAEGNNSHSVYVTFSNDGKRIASLCQDDTIIVWQSTSIRKSKVAAITANMFIRHLAESSEKNQHFESPELATLISSFMAKEDSGVAHEYHKKFYDRNTRLQTGAAQRGGGTRKSRKRRRKSKSRSKSNRRP